MGSDCDQLLFSGCCVAGAFRGGVEMADICQVEWYLRQTASPRHVQLGDLRVWHQGKGLHGEVSFFQENMTTFTYGTILELQQNLLGQPWHLDQAEQRQLAPNVLAEIFLMLAAGERLRDCLLMAWCMQPIFGKVGRCQEARIWTNLIHWNVIPLAAELPIESCNSDT